MNQTDNLMKQPDWVLNTARQNARALTGSAPAVLRAILPSSRKPAWVALTLITALHIAGLIYIAHQTPLTFNLESKGRPVSANGIEATLITQPAQPKPPEPQPEPKPPAPSDPQQETPKPVTKPAAVKVLAVKEKTQSTQTIAPVVAPTPQKKTPKSNVVPTPPTPPIETTPMPVPQPQAAPSQISPMLNIEGTQAKEVRQLNCNIPVPRYPARSIKLGEAGTTLLRVVIGADGAINQAFIVKSSGYSELDESARAALMRAACKPFVDNGQAIAVTATQPISFNLK